MKQKHAMEMKLLRKQLRPHKSVKYLNQCLKRKDEIIKRKKSTIRIIRHKLKNTKWAKEICRPLPTSRYPKQLYKHGLCCLSLSVLQQSFFSLIDYVLRNMLDAAVNKEKAA